MDFKSEAMWGGYEQEHDVDYEMPDMVGGASAKKKKSTKKKAAASAPAVPESLKKRARALGCRLTRDTKDGSMKKLSEAQVRKSVEAAEKRRSKASAKPGSKKKRAAS
jgi:hypothetical protein